MTQTDTAPSTMSAWTYADYLSVPDHDTDVKAPVMISRGELLDRLRQDGNEVPERLLRSWEASGMLPRPIRRWPATGDPSGSRLRYPDWAVWVVSTADGTRRAGLDPEQTRRVLEDVAVPQIVASYADGRRDGLRAGLIGHHLGRGLKTVIDAAPWPEGTTPAVMEVRILGQDGAELHVQKLSLPDGDEINDD